MAVRIRLRREGKKKQPYYRVVVANSRSPRDGRYIEDIGYYQPLHEPSTVEIDAERALHWLNTGAQPSDQAKQLLRITGIWEQFKPEDSGRDRSAKHEARRKAAEQRDAKIAAAEAEAAKRLAEAEAARVAEEEAAAAAVEEDATAGAATPAEDPAEATAPEDAPAEAGEEA